MSNEIKISHESQLLMGITPAKKEWSRRYSISGVHFNNKHVVATNGHALVMRRKSEGEPTNVTLRLERIKKEGAVMFKCLHEQSTCEREYLSIDGAKATTIDNEFPNYGYVVDGINDAGVVRVGLNAKYLYDLAMAMGATDKDAEVVLEIKDAESPIVLTRLRDDSSVGVLMPCRHESNPVATLNAIKA